VYRSRKKFEALRSFTLESGQEEIEQQRRLRKERSNDAGNESSIHSGSANPTSGHQGTPMLGNVPEEDGAFAIGDDDDDSENDQDHRPTPSQSSRTPSISSSVDDTVPLQLRGMSEKARGKMPAGTPTFSRQNSTTSLSSPTTGRPPTIGFVPSAQWVCTE
jgi:High-temperature-induced dauer-formation protein